MILSSRKIIMEHIDFHISYNCLNRCVFCSSSDSIRKCGSHPLGLDDIINLLKKKKRLGFKSINFTGGEPSVFPNFLALARQTKKLGFRIYVGTNGGRFAEAGFCREAAPFLDEVCFSCHGHNAALHNRLAANKDAFPRLKKAVGNLSGFPVSFSSNTVVTKYNIDYLGDIINILASWGIKHILISNLAPEGRGLKNFDRIAVKLAQIKKEVPALVKLADSKKIIIRFFGIPACVLGDSACCSNDFCWDGRLNIEQGYNGKFFLKEEKCFLPMRGRIKTGRCGTCIYESVCGGIFKEYFKKFGDEELETLCE